MPVFESTIYVCGYERIFYIGWVRVQGHARHWRMISVAQKVLDVTWIIKIATLGCGHDSDSSVCTAERQEHIFSQELSRLNWAGQVNTKFSYEKIVQRWIFCDWSKVSAMLAAFSLSLVVSRKIFLLHLIFNLVTNICLIVDYRFWRITVISSNITSIPNSCNNPSCMRNCCYSLSCISLLQIRTCCTRALFSLVELGS